ncbi:tetratricopeptide repeat protein [Stieleria marina]|uniref:Outer membrane protein assembly factor BamD n=1 Tax=Stieleria marina TaxID=1930275 RepID=A0A517NR11_9BACT|nr:Outer membrane protein assembly factor BamD [Planctomycetes bacterium K23_9]
MMSPRDVLNSHLHSSSKWMLLAGLAIALTGCQSLRKSQASDFGDTPLELISQGDSQSGSSVTLASGESTQGGVVTAGATESPSQANPVVQADGDAAAYTDADGGNRVVSFLTSWKEDPATAKSMYKKADAAFRLAKRKPNGKSSSEYSAAAKFFRKAGNAAPGSALQQDALFMQAESHFFANELNDATKTYQKLQKDFPRNRHNDRVAARLFDISKYWIATSRAGGDAWYKVNLFDHKRPGYDSKGHAIKVLDQIRYDDPTGRLADDATMAAAAEYIRQNEFEKADEFLTDLRETFTDSDHMFLAHLLGIRCKLEVYAGPNYSGLVLEESEKLIKQTRQRFPDKLQKQEYNEMLARATREVAYHQAERLAHRARYREKREEYGAATAQYQQILRDHPSAPQAKIARSRLQETQKLPAVPQKKLAFLTKVFPDSRQSSPLVPAKMQRKQTPANQSPANQSPANQPLTNETPTNQPTTNRGTMLR